MHYVIIFAVLNCFVIADTTLVVGRLEINKKKKAKNRLFVLNYIILINQ